LDLTKTDVSTFIRHRIRAIYEANPDIRDSFIKLAIQGFVSNVTKRQYDLVKEQIADIHDYDGYSFSYSCKEPIVIEELIKFGFEKGFYDSDTFVTFFMKEINQEFWKWREKQKSFFSK
jgi:hypothetical protein